MSQVPLYSRVTTRTSVGSSPGTYYRGTSLIRTPTQWDPEVALCLGTYGDPMGVGVSYERGTPAPDKKLSSNFSNVLLN